MDRAQHIVIFLNSRVSDLSKSKCEETNSFLNTSIFFQGCLINYHLFKISFTLIKEIRIEMNKPNT